MEPCELQKFGHIRPSKNFFSNDSANADVCIFWRAGYSMFKSDNLTSRSLKLFYLLCITVPFVAFYGVVTANNCYYPSSINGNLLRILRKLHCTPQNGFAVYINKHTHTRLIKISASCQ